MKGIIFDLDGVICFTDKFHYLAWKKAVEPLGIELNETLNNRLRGVSRLESLNIILERYPGRISEEEKLRLCEYKNGLYREHLLKMNSSDVSSEVVSTLKTLKTKGYKLAIGSSSKNARLILERLEIKELFDAISDGNVITRSKPDPEVFLKAAEYLGIQPADCLVVEDAEAGVEAGIAGGFCVAGLGPASKHPKTHYSLDNFSDLLQYI